MARASPTRLRMPPDSSAGYFFSMLKSPSECSLSRTISRISARSSWRRRCSHQREQHVLLDGEGVEERRVLEEHAELRADPVELEVAHRHDVLAVDEDLAAVRLEQPDQVLHQHRLPRARPADDHVDLAALDLQVDAAQHLVLAEALVQAADLQLVALGVGRRRASVRRPRGWPPRGRCSLDPVAVNVVKPQNPRVIRMSVTPKSRERIATEDQTTARIVAIPTPLAPPEAL